MGYTEVIQNVSFPRVSRNSLIPEGNIYGSYPFMEFANCTTLKQKLKCFCRCYFWFGEEEQWTDNSEASYFLHYEIRSDFINWCNSPFYDEDPTEGINYSSSTIQPISRVRQRFYFEFRKYLKSKPEVKRLQIENALNSLKPKDLVRVLYTFTVDGKAMLEYHYGI